MLAGEVGPIVIVTCEAGTDALACKAVALQHLKLTEMYSWLRRLAAQHKFVFWVCRQHFVFAKPQGLLVFTSGLP